MGGYVCACLVGAALGEIFIRITKYWLEQQDEPYKNLALNKADSRKLVLVILVMVNMQDFIYYGILICANRRHYLFAVHAFYFGGLRYRRFVRRKKLPWSDHLRQPCRSQYTRGYHLLLPS